MILSKERLYPKAASSFFNMVLKQNAIVRILKLFQTRKKAVLILVSLVVFSAGFDITVPFITQRLIDTIFIFFQKGGDAPIAVLFFAALAILVATVSSRFLKSMYDYRLFKEATQREDALRNAVLAKYYGLHVLFHHGSSSGQIIGRIERGATAIYTIIHDLFGEHLLPPLIVFLGILFSLITKDVWITLAIFWPLPVYLLSIKKISERIYLIEKRVNDEMEAVSKEAYDVAANILTVKKFSQEGPELVRQMTFLKSARETQYSAERLWSVMENIQTLLATIGRIGVILLGGFFVLNGRSTVGELVLYIALNNMVYAPMAQLSNVIPRLRRNVARVERLLAVLDEPVAVLDKPNAALLPPHRQAIEFKDVWFRYGEGRRWIIKDVNVVIPAGSTVALVGRSGSGKTTFINLLLRSYDPEQGTIRIDGCDLRDIKRESLLAQIAVVPQEVDLFSRSIIENIAYGKPEVSAEEVVRAAKTALAHDFILKTEDGYETVVGEKGIKLSGGERQRIGIARAILRDPRILILDEATSHLDTESERLIAEATDALIKNRTTIIIAHRLSTIMRADTILVFSRGEIEARGKHEELLRASPTYQRLHALQFSRSI